MSHYGRLCPIETPEGTNIGLISTLAIYASLDEYGFLTTPYRVVKNGKVTDEVVRLRADEEFHAVLAPADTPIDDKGRLVPETEPARSSPASTVTSTLVEGDDVQYMDVSPEADRRRVRGADPVPRARRRQPRADGIQHAAAGRAAARHRAAARRHRHGAGRRGATRAW